MSDYGKYITKRKVSDDLIIQGLFWDFPKFNIAYFKQSIMDFEKGKANKTQKSFIRTFLSRANEKYIRMFFNEEVSIKLIRIKQNMIINNKEGYLKLSI